jgi:predicted ribonuclease YlaK
MDQQDNPYLSSGTSIESLVNRLKSESMFSHINFTKSERSELAQLASKLLSELD